MPTLSVSIVTYFSDDKWFKATCASLFAALAHARVHAGISASEVTLIDNTDDGSDARQLYEGVTSEIATLKIKTGHGNVGYGAGHNLALMKSKANFHLVLNPDVTLKRDAITQAINLMMVRADAICLTPSAVDQHGNFTSLCKRHVTPGILAMRAFAPGWLKRRDKAALDAYEYRGELGEWPMAVVSASGAFMFLRMPAAQKIGGFDERFFLHFEDVDYSLRLHARGYILYAPQVKVVHAGGGGARKHLKHLLINGFRYFRKWGVYGDPLTRVPRSKHRLHRMNEDGSTRKLR